MHAQDTADGLHVLAQVVLVRLAEQRVRFVKDHSLDRLDTPWDP